MPAWASNDANLDAFLQRLSEAQFSYSKLTGELIAPPWFEAFVNQAKARERAGRDKFGVAYLKRENPVEAMEEAVDGALYMYLHGLRCLREGRLDEADVRLTAAACFAKAHQACQLLISKERGNAGPGFGE